MAPGRGPSALPVLEFSEPSCVLYLHTTHIYIHAYMHGYIDVCIHVCICIFQAYVYMYVGRERDGERER